MSALTVKAIVAADEGWAIGNLNKLPWHLPDDLKRFSALTKGHTVLMGRATFDSLPSKFRPLPGRLNVIVSRTLSAPIDGSYAVRRSPEEALSRLEAEADSLPSKVVWVIGGEQIYRATKAYWSEVYLTRVKGRHQGDAFFPELGEEFALAESEDFPTHSFQRFIRHCSQPLGL